MAAPLAGGLGLTSAEAGYGVGPVVVTYQR